MPLYVSPKVKAEMSQRAAAIGGWEGWPTPDWNKGMKRFLTYGPFFGMHRSTKDFPISGNINGRLYGTFRVSTEFTKMILGGRRITTYYHTAVIFPDLRTSMPTFDLISVNSQWDEIQSVDRLRTPTGDQQFDFQFIVAANESQHPQVLSLLTPQVKQAALAALHRNSSLRIRFGMQQNTICAWINGKEARDGNLPPLLHALADLANVVDAMSPAPAPGMGMPPAQGMPPGAPNQPYPQQYPNQQQYSNQQQYPNQQQHPNQQPYPQQYPNQPYPAQPVNPAQPMYPPQPAQGPYPPQQPYSPYPQQPQQQPQQPQPQPQYAQPQAQPGYPQQPGQPPYPQQQPQPGQPPQPQPQPGQPPHGYQAPQPNAPQPGPAYPVNPGPWPGAS